MAEKRESCMDSCTHYEVCSCVTRLRQSFGNIIKIHVGGSNPAWKEFDALVIKSCQYFLRKENG